MSIFENFTKKVSDVAQVAKEKSEQLLEVTKLNASISNEESAIQKLYVEMGKKVYDVCNSSTTISNEIFSEMCEQIKKHQDSIEELKKKINEVKKVRICASCGNETSSEIEFCPKCGTKQEKSQPVTAFEIKTCPSCGKPSEGAAFCPGCGTKIE